MEEAEKLREEAQDLLASYQRKQRDAVKGAEAIVEHAKDEAKRLTQQGRRNRDRATATVTGIWGRRGVYLYSQCQRTNIEHRLGKQPCQGAVTVSRGSVC